MDAFRAAKNILPAKGYGLRGTFRVDARARRLPFAQIFFQEILS